MRMHAAPPEVPRLAGSDRGTAAPLALGRAQGRRPPSGRCTHQDPSRRGRYDHRNPSLASGSAGWPCAPASSPATRSDQMVADVALTHLEAAVDVLATEPLTSSLYSGFTGIAWAVELVDRCSVTRARTAVATSTTR